MWSWGPSLVTHAHHPLLCTSQTSGCLVGRAAQGPWASCFHSIDVKTKAKNAGNTGGHSGFRQRPELGVSLTRPMWAALRPSPLPKALGPVLSDSSSGPGAPAHLSCPPPPPSPLALLSTVPRPPLRAGAWHGRHPINASKTHSD